MKVVVGLGNPGSKYAGTRHNIGFEVVDYLAAAPGVRLFRPQFQSWIAEATEGSEKVLLVKPETYMNLSGRAVRAIVDFYKVSIHDLMVISDDYNLPLGRLRMRGNGSHGGQNGLRNIQEQLGTDAYPRLRVGVGQPEFGNAVDFVLSRFRPGERTTMDDAVARAAQSVLVWIRSGLEAGMNTANPAESKGNRKDERKPKTPNEGPRRPKKPDEAPDRRTDNP